MKNPPPPPPPLPSMESQYRDDPLHTLLPSPYSIEDLRSGHGGQDQNPILSLQQNSTHGHTKKHTTRSSSYHPPQQQQQLEQQQRHSRALSCDALNFYSPPQILSTDILFGATKEQSRPHYRSSTEEDRQPPVQANNQHQQQQLTSPYTDYSLPTRSSLPTSPYHQHRQNTHPAPLRVLSYTSTNESHGSKEYSNAETAADSEEKGNQPSPLNDQKLMMMMNSTVINLPPSEKPLGFQSSHDLFPPRRRRLPSPPDSPTKQATTATDPTKSATKKKKSPTAAKSSAKVHSTPPPPPSTQSQPTNYVYINRKCNPSTPITSKPQGRRKTVAQPNTQIPSSPPKLPSSSAITGTFTIDPELYIPPSILNAVEDPVFFRFKPLSDTEHIDESRNRKLDRTRRGTNLRLEVENGGIDVDIHLVPTTTTISNNVGKEEDEATCTGNRGQQQQQDTTYCDSPLQAHASANTSTTAFSGPPSSTTRQSTTSLIRIQENPSGGTTSSRKGITIPEVMQHTSSSRRDKKKPSRPTTIDMRIKQAYDQQDSLNLQNQDSVKINDGPIALPLIARIVSFTSRFIGLAFL